VGVAVSAAPLRSGALITAGDALEQGREVFAMPGNVDYPTCEGSNKLLREGAAPLISSEDIVSEYIGRFPGKITRASGDNSAAGSSRGRAADKPAGRPYVKAEESEKKRIDNSAALDYIDPESAAREFTGDEASVVRAMRSEPTHIDGIIARSGLPASRVLPVLTMLEIRGVVTQGSGKFFSLSRRSRKTAVKEHPDGESKQ
jgi:DNA processing protein